MVPDWSHAPFFNMAIDFESLALSPVVTVLGQEVTFTPDGGAAETVTAVWEKSYQGVSPEGDIVVQSTQPRLLVKRDDLSKFPEDPDTFTVSGTTYRVIEAQEDGQGGLQVYLHKT